MANEFVARKGLIVSGNGQVTGSLNVSGGITGSLFGTASWAANATSASAATSITFTPATASFAVTASYAINAGGTAAIIYVIDGGGSAITTGVKGDLVIPFGCTITEWTLLADQAGSIVIDIWKDTYANYPPTVGDSITAAAKPTLSSVTNNQSSTLTGWTATITSGDTLRFNVDSVSTVTRVTLTLKVTKV